MSTIGSTQDFDRQIYLPFSGSIWVEVKDGNPYGLKIFQRHYSKYHYKDGRKPKLFVGPGQKIVLISHDGMALFVWRKFISNDGQQGVNCAVFRNESTMKSSEMILEAEAIATRRWPGERFFTYVNPRRIKSKNPGYCFKLAGWNFIGITKKNKLHILEKII